MNGSLQIHEFFKLLIELLPSLSLNRHILAIETEVGYQGFKFQPGVARDAESDGWCCPIGFSSVGSGACVNQN
jgi:hypothetical protein